MLYQKILVLFLCMPVLVWGQTSELKGKVTFENEPLEFVNVLIPSLGKGISTDSKGEYSLKNIPQGTYQVEVSGLGFKTIRWKLTLKGDQAVVRNFEMEEDDMALEEVVVIDKQSGLNTRTPYSVSKIDAKGIEKKGNPSGIMGMVMDDPAVYGAEMGQGIVKPFIRGLGFSRVVTIYQSNKLENHQWGADHGLGLNDLGVSSIDIIKGPASILYGSGALGGVLLIKDDESYFYRRDWTGNVGMTFNSVSGGYRPHFSLGKSYDNGFFVATDFAYENHADYKDGNGRIIGNSRYNSTNFRFHTGLNKENFQNKLSYTYLKQELGIIEDDEMDDELTLATTRYDRKMQLPFQEVTDHLISYTQSTTHDKWETALSVSYHMNIRKEIEDDFDEVDLGLKQSHLFYNARVTHETTEKLKNTLGVQGSFINNRNMIEAEEILIPDADLFDIGVYYMAGWDIGNYFVQGGIRYDHREVMADARRQHLIDYGFILPGDPADRTLTKTFSGFTGSLGVSRKLDAENTIKLNASTGFRAPDLAELFSNGPHPGTNRFERGNADFGREQSYQADLNWIYTGSKFRSSMAVFANKVENYIFFTNSGETINDGLELWEFSQTDALLYGTEVQMSYHPNGDNSLFFTATANLVRGEDTINDRYLTFVPADNYTLRVDYKPFKTQLTNTFLSLRYVDEQSRPGLNEEVTAAYTLLNAGINHDFKWGEDSLTVGVTGFNLLNRTYVDHMSILRAFNITHAGRNVMLNVLYRF